MHQVGTSSLLTHSESGTADFERGQLEGKRYGRWDV